MKSNWLDLQHRGFAAYLKEAAGTMDPEIVRAQTGSEHFDVVLTDCDVKTDWIEQIETALPFIENAVRENRQFILRQGETVPIEKAKRISRSSVEHLSRHSELISKEPQPGENLIPDKMHITENIGTYTVYENRFLYMLLCYLRDFTGYRYKKILQLQAAFSSEVSISKEISGSTRNIRYSLHYSESTLGLEGVQKQETEAAIARIVRIMQTVDLLLRTDLMKEVSTAPMLKPPITRTNVLLHDPNFRVAFALHSFLSTYDEDGFAQVERYRSSGKFTAAMDADYTALQALTAYLSYRNGGLREELEQRFLAEEKRRKDAAEQEQQALLAALKQQLGEIDGPALAYILALEERNRQLDSRADALFAEQTLRAQVQEALDAAQAENARLLEEIRQKDAVIYSKEREVQHLTRNNAQLLQDIQRQKQSFEAHQTAAQQQHEAQLAQQKQEFLREYTALVAELNLANAKVRAHALASGNEDPHETFDTRETFAQLEAEYKAFARYYKKQWKLAKKQLRKQLWQRNDG